MMMAAATTASAVNGGCGAALRIANSDTDIAAAIAVREPTATAVVNVWAEWAAGVCEDTNALFADLAEDYRNITLVQATCDAVPLFISERSIDCVPTFLVFENGKETARYTGANASQLADIVAACAESARPPTPALQRYTPPALSAADAHSSSAKITNETVASRQIIALMSALESPKATVCDLTDDTNQSMQRILGAAHIEYQVFTVSPNSPEQDMLRRLSQSDEFPQIYVSGTFICGLAAFLELQRTGQLESRFATTGGVNEAASAKTLAARLDALVRQMPLMVFIKGTPQTPRCGYSRQLVAILDELGYEYGYFDILTDEQVRQGLKKQFDWPTYPQVYIRGELVGGIDIVREMVSTGDFQRMIGVAEEGQ